MLKINDSPVILSHFTDRALDMRCPQSLNIEATARDNKDVYITWFFESNEEIVALSYLTQYLREHGVHNIHLHMPYIPYARQDRVKHPEDLFTLKYFANLINGLNFTSVCVRDPHSRVAEALIDRIVRDDVSQYILAVLRKIKRNNLVLCFPDEGASKRYENFDLPYVFGLKKRNWQTRQIESLQLIGPTDIIKDCKVLIIDDICSKGATALSAAKAAKDAGAKEIHLFATHCENTMLNNTELLEVVNTIYTTRSIYTEHHPQVIVL